MVPHLGSRKCRWGAAAVQREAETGQVRRPRLEAAGCALRPVGVRGRGGVSAASGGRRASLLSARPSCPGAPPAQLKAPSSLWPQCTRERGGGTWTPRELREPAPTLCEL